jgi:hypothetical protein
MMGIKDRSFSVLPHNISLEDLVPKENPLRKTSTGSYMTRWTSPSSGIWCAPCTLVRAVLQ